MSCIKIAPSILSANFLRLEEELRAVETGGADSVHIDVMDGRFVPNITIGHAVVKSIRGATSLPLDVHLMIVEPERYIEKFALAGANYIYVHIEACIHLHRIVEEIKKLGCRAAVALNPSTPLSAVDEILQHLDRILIMSVNPGLGGQEFIDSSLGKITRARKKIDEIGKPVELEVDGGVNTENIGKIVKAGATNVVTGSAVFGTGNPIDAIRRLRKSVEG